MRFNPGPLSKMPNDKNLIWDKEKEYESGSIVWYEGIFYFFAVEPPPPPPAPPPGSPPTPPQPPPKSVKGSPPNEQMATFRSIDFNSWDFPPADDEFMSERAWIMIDPRSIQADEWYESNAPVGPAAAQTSAQLRGFRSLSLYPESANKFNPTKYGSPAYYGDVTQFTSRGEGGLNENISWKFYHSNPGLSADQGEGTPITIEWMDTSVEPPVKKTQVVGNWTPKSKYLLLNGGITKNEDRQAYRPISAALLPEAKTDNQGRIDAADNADLYGNNQFPNDEIPGLFTGSKTYEIGTNFGGSQDPITMTMINGLFGAKLSYRCLFTYYKYQEVMVPPPFITGQPVKKYFRTGGNLTLVEGDGITTPRIYRWNPPYQKPETIVVNQGEFTLKASHEKYNEFQPIVFVHQVTEQPIRIKGGQFLPGEVVYSEIDPEQPN